MSNLVFRHDDGIGQLVQASTMLIDEATSIFSNIDIESLDLKQLNRYASTLLHNIDKTSSTIEALAGIPNENLVRARLMLQLSVDKHYSHLTELKVYWQLQVLSGEATTPEMIGYANFCSDLALKLLTRASDSIGDSPNPLPIVLTPEEQLYL